MPSMHVYIVHLICVRKNRLPQWATQFSLLYLRLIFEIEKHISPESQSLDLSGL